MSTTQRHTASHPCRVCGGYDSLPQGLGVRCYGFVGADGRYAHCTREDSAHGLPQEAGGTFAHRLDGLCACGHEHPAANGHNRNGHGPAAPRRHKVGPPHAWEIVPGIVHKRQDYDDGTKGVWWETDGKPGLNGRKVETLPLYGRHALNGATGIIVVEGEAARDALQPLAHVLGLGVLGTVTGAKSRPADAVLEALPPELPLYLWPDTDDPGEAHMTAIAASRPLQPRTVARIDWPGARPGAGDDAADFVRAGGTTDELAALIATAAPWKPEPRPETAARLVIRPLTDVTAKPVAWLWPRWLARGKLHLLGGHAGDGKSALITALAAIGSTGGTWPDGMPAPRFRTLFVLGEDAIDDTLRPRLDLFGADVSQVHAMETVLEGEDQYRVFNIAKHLPLLEAAIVAHGFDVVIVDPLTFIMPGTDRNAEGDTRDALTPLIKMADRTDVAVMGIAHVGKPSGTLRTPAQRILGATAFHAMSRIVWMTTALGDGLMAVGPVKTNLSIKPRAVQWHWDEDQPLEWQGVSESLLEDLLDARGPSTLRDDAEGWLRERLAKGAVKSAVLET
jgi:AAA domain